MTMKIKEDVINWLKFYGYTVIAEDDFMLDFIISQEEQYIKNYCSISEIPQELRFCLIDMCVGRFLQHKKTTGGIDGFNLEAAIESIKEGDTTVSFNSNSPTDEQRLDSLISYLTRKNRAELNKFRRIKW